MYKLLVVDDEAIERKAIKFIVKNSELRISEIMEAANGHEAVAIAETFNPDIVTMDIMMPGLNGIEAGLVLKERKPDVKIVFVTAYDSFEYAHEAIKIGVEEFIIKPALNEKTLEILQSCINKSWAKLIHKVYNVDPLKCSQCGGNMKIISFIEEESLIKKILKHLNLWLDDKQEPPNHSPPQHILDLINTNIDILYQQNTVRMRTGNTLINAKFTYYDSFKQESCGYIPQMPFEDEYSQLVPYDD